MSYIKIRTVLIIIIIIGVSCRDANMPAYLSPLDLALRDDGRTLLITQHTVKRLDLFDIIEQTLVKSISLSGRPGGLACGDSTAYITTGEGKGLVSAIDIISGTVRFNITVGHGPVAPVLSPDRQMLYVCNRFDNTVGFVDLARQKQVKLIRVKREPVAAALTPDGKRLFVANHLPAGPANVDYVAAEISVIDTEKGEVVKSIKLPNGSEGLRDISVSADGKYVCATHLIARFQVPTTQIERGWISTNAFSVVRVSDLKLFSTVLLDDVDRGFANPWGVAFSKDGNILCISSSGNHEICLIDFKALKSKLDNAILRKEEKDEGNYPSIHDDFSILTGLRERIELKGLGARNILFHDDHFYITEYFSGSLGVISPGKEGKATNVQSVSLGNEPPLTLERKGELCFNDARLCFQSWLSCASCHPDARADGLNWDLLNDGIGNYKNVKSMYLSHETPPAMSLGVRADAETAVSAGLRHIQFLHVMEEDAAAIDAFLRDLRQVPSPHLVNGSYSVAAERGKKLFDESGCIHCHPPPLYTNLKSYDTSTGTGKDKGKKFDVPTLREVWRTAPYLHDGRAVTIEEVITIHNMDDKRGSTSMLNEKQIRDLAEYIRSL